MTYTIKGSLITCRDCEQDWEHICPLCKATPYGSIADQLSKEKSKKVKKSKSQREQVPEQPTPITIDNFFVASFGVWKEIEEIPTGFSKFFKSKGSEYYRNTDGSKVVRKSDHWGSRIRFCTWYLYGYKKLPCFRWNAEYGKDYKIGIISINEFEIHQKQVQNTTKIKTRSFKPIVPDKPIDEWLRHRIKTANKSKELQATTNGKIICGAKAKAYKECLDYLIAVSNGKSAVGKIKTDEPYDLSTK